MQLYAGEMTRYNNVAWEALVGVGHRVKRTTPGNVYQLQPSGQLFR